jgi:hypothetical protein
MPAITSARVAAATSVLALVVAMGGTGYAAVKIKGNQIAKNAITSAKVKNDSLTGSDVKESTLGKVPSAGAADSAASATDAGSVGGIKVAKVNFQSNVPGPVTVFSGAGLTLRAGCVGGLVSLVATTSTNHASIYSIVHSDSDAANPMEDDLESGSFDLGVPFNVLAGGDGNIDFVSFEYDTPAGAVVTGQLAVDEAGADSCSVTGMVMAG